jgi:hypothetical protein
MATSPAVSKELWKRTTANLHPIHDKVTALLEGMNLESSFLIPKSHALHSIRQPLESSSKQIALCRSASPLHLCTSFPAK